MLRSGGGSSSYGGGFSDYSSYGGSYGGTNTQKVSGPLGPSCDRTITRAQYASHRSAQDEDFYGFGDFFNDLGKELNERSKQRKDSGKGPKTLMEVRAIHPATPSTTPS